MIEKYRENVAVIVCNSKGKVLVCARADQKENEWQFPQGGIDKGESVLDAAKRELCEETGICDVVLIKEMPNGVSYRFPNGGIKKFQQDDICYMGQNQHYVLFQLVHDNVKIDFETHPEEIEFRDYEWVDPDEACKRIVYFKKAAYEKAIAYFKPLIREICINNY